MINCGTKTLGLPFLKKKQRMKYFMTLLYYFIFLSLKKTVNYGKHK